MIRVSNLGVLVAIALYVESEPLVTPVPCVGCIGMIMIMINVPINTMMREKKKPRNNPSYSTALFSKGALFNCLEPLCCLKSALINCLNALRGLHN